MSTTGWCLLCGWLASIVTSSCQAFVFSRHLSQRSCTARQATWSNGQAVQDYQQFLSSGQQEIQTTDDTASVIVVSDTSGPTPLSQALLKMGMGDDIILTTPSQSNLPPTLDNHNEYPIYITLPPNEIQDFLMNLPESFKARAEDFVFFAGGAYGNIEDALKDRGASVSFCVESAQAFFPLWHYWLTHFALYSISLGYCRDQMTQVVIGGMKITDYESRVIDTSVHLGTSDNGEPKLAGECSACGKWAGSVVQRLERSNIRCKLEFYREWRRTMWERSVYDAVFSLVGAIRNEPTTYRDVANYYNEEVSDMLWEFSQLLRGWKAITLLFGFEERLFGMAEASEEICEVKPSQLYEFVYGNPVYLNSKTFVEYLQFAQAEKGLLAGVELPQNTGADYKSNMRQGNLRADGAI